MSWFKELFGTSSKPVSADDGAGSSKQTAPSQPLGHVDGGHYAESVEKIEQLKRDGKYEEAKELLLKCVEATEGESRASNSNSARDQDFQWLGKGRKVSGFGVAPWYYEQLAIIYRKSGQYASEVEILERYEKQKKAPGSGPRKLAQRLEKARALLAKSRT